MSRIVNFILTCSYCLAKEEEECIMYASKATAIDCEDFMDKAVDNGWEFSSMGDRCPKCKKGENGRW